MNPILPLRAQGWSYTSVRQSVTDATGVDTSICAINGRSAPAILRKLPMTISRVWSAESAIARRPPSVSSLVGSVSCMSKPALVAPVDASIAVRRCVVTPLNESKLPPT